MSEMIKSPNIMSEIIKSQEIKSGGTKFSPGTYKE